MFGTEHDVIARVTEGPAYVPSVQHVGNGRGALPIRKDFALNRGTWVRGRISNQVTGEPVRAGLNYHVLVSNPHLKDYRSYGTIRCTMPFATNHDGEFQIAVMPGRAILGTAPIYTFDNIYLTAVGIDKLNVKKAGPIGDIREALPDVLPFAYSRLVEINPKVGEEMVKVDIALDPGRTVKGRLIGPDGEPVIGALWLRDAERFEHWSTPNTLPTDEFEMHVRPRGKVGLLFYQEEKQLAGAYLGEVENGGFVSVKMERCGTLTGRLLGDGGMPRAAVWLTSDRPYAENVQLLSAWKTTAYELARLTLPLAKGELEGVPTSATAHPNHQSYPESWTFSEEGESRFEFGSLPHGTRTDADGRFRLSGLVPELKYSLNAWGEEEIVGEVVKAVIIKAGETKDVGDVAVSR